MHKKILISFFILNQFTNLFALTLTKTIPRFEEPELTNEIICNLDHKQILAVLNDSLIELLKDTSYHRYRTFLKLYSDILVKENKTIEDLTKIHEELLKEFSDLDDFNAALYTLDSKIRPQLIRYFFDVYKVNIGNEVKLESVLDKLVDKTDGLSIRDIEIVISNALDQSKLKDDNNLMNIHILHNEIKKRKNDLIKESSGKYLQESQKYKNHNLMIYIENYYTIITSLGLTISSVHDLLNIYYQYKENKANKDKKDYKKKKFSWKDSSIFRICPFILGPTLLNKS